MKKRDYYEILSISREAEPKEIKQAYRRLAMELHPDRNPDPAAEDKFKEAAEAYDILSNPEKREIYNRYGHEGLQGNTGFSGVDDIFSSFGDVFSEFFGGDIFGRRRSRPPRPPRGADIRFELNLTFEESIKGVKKVIDLVQLRRCQACDGIGAAPGSHPEACSTCGGHGQVVQRTGFMTLATMCPNCQGRGTWISNPCKVCEGTGKAPFERSVSVKVPPGVDTGMRLRIAGEGEMSEAGGEPGNLDIYFTIEPYEGFEREGNDIFCVVEIPFTKAILGHSTTIEFIDEQIKLEIAPGTQPGEVIRIEGKGAPYTRQPDHSGDMYVTIKVVLPKELGKEQRDLLLKLDKKTL